MEREELVQAVERRAAKAQRAGLFLVLGLAAAAAASELRKPREEREWHGRVAGFVPYDFRPPSVDRILETWWRPEDPRFFVRTAFGVGWDLNLGRVVHLVSRVAA